jgi:subtilisin family serine protease
MASRAWTMMAMAYVDDIYGWDFFYDDNTIYHEDADEDYHGTHCAGIIGARGNDAVEGGFHGGVAGVAWDVQIMSCKFLGDGGGSNKRRDQGYQLRQNDGRYANQQLLGRRRSYSRALEEAIANSACCSLQRLETQA